MFYRHCFSTLLSIMPLGGSGKPGWFEIKWYTSLLFYAADVNILGGNVRAIKNNTETIIVVNKEYGPEVTADKN